ncbi:paraquat-inducible protein A [Kosakonia sp. MUSA4]|uniref:paraquat-inducible protein A n=1 Tax=Kosakonia sp. MUSA4 TaxID=2067958 RepID=UPI001ABFEEA0|nr:paraquat-inducible protein A [Kosakonia sp. MUSA4]
MNTEPHLITCPVCGHLARNPANQTVICPRCRCVVWRSSLVPYRLLLPLTLTALITLVAACFSPVMSINAYGMHNAVSLWQTVSDIAGKSGMPGLAIGVACLLIALPLIQLLLLVRILLPGRERIPGPQFITAMTILRWIRPWCMTDVALLGFAVSAVKLSDQFTVSAGPGGWALAVTVLICLVLTHQDPRRYWQRFPLSEPGAQNG